MATNLELAYIDEILLSVLSEWEGGEGNMDIMQLLASQ
jgi:hypothetical protein